MNIVEKIIYPPREGYQSAGFSYASDKEKVSSGAFVIPTLKATPGYFKVSKPRKGY